MEREPSNLANALSDWVCHREKLISLLVEEQMIIAEVVPAHVPVEVFRFYIEREYICENCVHRATYVFDRRTRQICSRRERCVASLCQLQSFFRIRFVHGIATPVGC